MADLKPCPFCGHKAVVEDCGDNSYFVRCSHCSINQDKLYAQKCDAVKAWNRRADYNIKSAPTVDAVPWMWLEAFAKAKPFYSVDEFIAEAKEMNCKMYSCCCADGERKE